MSILIAGHLLNHDDSTTDRSEGSQRNIDETETKRLWFSWYDSPLAVPGVFHFKTNRVKGLFKGNGI